MEKIQEFFRIIKFFHLSPKGIPSLSIINCQLSIQQSPLFLILPSQLHNNRKLSLDLSGAIGYNEENFIKKKRG